MLQLIFKTLNGKEQSLQINFKKQAVFLLFIWFIVQLLIFLQTGIKPILESLKYIGAAEQLIATQTLPGIRYFFYLSTTLIIAVCLKLNLGYTGVVVIQLIINLIATSRFFLTLSKIQHQTYSAFITTLLLILCIPYQNWNFYLYTESLFYSFTLLFFASCISGKKIKRKSVLIQFTWLFLAIISRPLGILLLPCWLLFIITSSKQTIRSYLLISFIVGIAFFLYISNLILGNINDWQILKPGEFNYIICDIPTGSKNNLELLKNGTPIHQLINYVITYPRAFVSLAIDRIKAFFFLIRPYYSKSHNIYLLVLCSLLYLPVLITFFRKSVSVENYRFQLLSISIIFLFTLSVCLQCDDYHNRFHHSLIPIFLYLGVFHLLENHWRLPYNKEL